MRREEIKQRVEEILGEIEECKVEDIEEAIMETLGGEHYHLKALREKRKEEIKRLKKRLEDTREELEETTRKYKQALRQKQNQIERLKSIDKLEELPEAEDLELEEEDLASRQERENVANKFIHLANKITENRYLANQTLETFDFYRDKMIARVLKEQELGEKLSNINR